MKSDNNLILYFFTFLYQFAYLYKFAYILVFFWIIKRLIKHYKRKKINNFFHNNVIKSQEMKDKYDYHDVSRQELEKFKCSDINQLKEYFYDIFIQFENAYNNLDFGLMKQLSTEQLFQNYYTGATLDLEVGRKRIIENITKKKVTLYGLDSTVAKQVACLIIEINYNNYTLNKEGYVTQGNRYIKKTEKFDVVFRKDFDKKAMINCPNCGATLKNGKCEYCKSEIKYNEFRISSIKRIIGN